MLELGETLADGEIDGLTELLGDSDGLGEELSHSKIRSSISKADDGLGEADTLLDGEMDGDTELDGLTDALGLMLGETLLEGEIEELGDNDGETDDDGANARRRRKS